MLWIGLDEAGYGPTLGPLAIGCAVWRVPDDFNCAAAQRSLKGLVVTTHPTRATDAYESWLAKQRAAGKTPNPATLRKKLPPLWIADSKRIHQPGDLQRLERTVTPLLRLVHGDCSCKDDLARNCVAGWSAARSPWDWDGAIRLPLAIRNADVPPVDLYRERFAAHGIELLDLRVRLVFPDEFNRELSRLGNKSTLLSQVTLELLTELLAKHRDEAAVIDADKHGGRDAYAGVMQHVRPEGRIEIEHESRTESRYIWTLDGLAHRIAFRARGESSLATAAASMTAKYLREVAMYSFNKYWRGLSPNLAPTAGYPLDARRFLAETAALRSEKNVRDELLIRRK